MADLLGTIEDAVTSNPLYVAFAGEEMPLLEFMLEWFPLLMTVALPVVCVAFAVIGCGKKEKPTTGLRIVKRVA